MAEAVSVVSVVVGGLQAVKMKKTFLILLLGVIFFSFASADVNEYNSFKYGEMDSNHNLIPSSTPVSGVNVKGFVCSVADCSASAGDYNFGVGSFVSGSGANFVYPTSLLSSHGYGFWVYKDGYIPYWVKGVTWYGTGAVAGVDRYLSKEQVCSSDVSVLDVYEIHGEWFIEVDSSVDSPIVELYGSIYLPNEIIPHLNTLVGVTAEVRDSAGNIAWSQRLERNIGYSGTAVYPFYLALDDGDYTVTVTSDLENEAKCLSYVARSDSEDFRVGEGFIDNDFDNDGVPWGEDCNDEDPNVWQLLVGYADADSDDYGAGSSGIFCAGDGLNDFFAPVNGDCDDSDFDVNPGVLEICDDGIDNNCDNHIDEGCASLDLVVVEVTCFDEVVEGHNQSCSVFIENTDGDAIGDVDVDVYYSNGDLFGSCSSNAVSGACSAKDLQDSVGSFEVYATVSRTGYVSDDSGVLRFEYDVFAEEYAIVDLKIYRDANFTYEDYDFFRGEDLFVKFSVEDLSGNVALDDLVSSVSLVSSVAGGRVELEEIEIAGGVYYYRLIPVPITHEFLGDSNVFAFVFDFDDSAAGQEEVSLIIRNNLPTISPDLPDRDIDEDEEIEVNLSYYENDIEDSGDNLTWEVVSSGNDVDVRLIGKTLFIEGLRDGNAKVVLRLVDLDEDYDEQSFYVEVGEGDDDDDDDDSSCRSNWDCLSWSNCVNGFETRVCVDTEGCGRNSNRPMEIRKCYDLGLSGTGDDVMSLNEFSSGKKGKSSLIWWIIIGIVSLFFLEREGLICLLLVLVFF